MKKIFGFESLTEFLTTTGLGRTIELVYAKEPTMRKRNNPYLGRVVKVTNCQVKLGDYARSVNRHTDGETKFVSKPLPWGTWKVYDRIITNKDMLYAAFKFHPSPNPTKVVYYLDGRLATKNEVEDIKTFITDKDFESKRQTDAGVAKDEQIHPMTMNYNNIVYLCGDGVEYRNKDKALYMECFD